MFNVIRPQPGPDCSKDYRAEEVIKALRVLFHGKCYLCEDIVSDPEVEHFIAKEINPALERDWNNLFYACGRCNSIKVANIDNKKLSFHDCSDAAIDVSRAVKCLCPSVPDNDVIVEVQDITDITKNTATLLERCYNENNTGIRGISRELLHDKLFEYYVKFLNYWLILHSQDTLQSEKEEAIEHLTNMTSVTYPFSTFWKWHILSDAFLTIQFPNI